MKKKSIGRIGMLLSVLLFFTVVCFSVMKVEAAEIMATVHGTVLSGTTSDLIKLNANGVNMLIKVDSQTDMSDCKVLVPGFNIGVSVYRGDDAYLHAAKITTDLQTDGVILDSSTKQTVYGKILDDTTTNIIFLQTTTGNMQIKYNASTDTSACALLVPGKSVYVTIVRGSDAYQHALSISDSQGSNGSSGSSSGSSSVDYQTVSNTSGTVITVTGTVDSATNNQYIYLNTSAGSMCIKVDNALDTTDGKAMIPGRAVTAYVYRGSDAYMHATKIAGSKEAVPSVTIDYGTTYTVTGTVDSQTTENVLYLNTNAGQMQIKLDSNTGYTNCKYFYKGKTVTVTCARGSDAYLHATIVSGN